MKSQGNCHKLCSPFHRGANPMAEIQIRSLTMSLRQYVHCIKPEIDIDQYLISSYTRGYLLLLHSDQAAEYTSSSRRQQTIFLLPLNDDTYQERYMDAKQDNVGCLLTYHCFENLPESESIEIQRAITRECVSPSILNVPSVKQLIFHRRVWIFSAPHTCMQSCLVQTQILNPEMD